MIPVILTLIEERGNHHPVEALLSSKIIQQDPAQFSMVKPNPARREERKGSNKTVHTVQLEATHLSSLQLWMNQLKPKMQHFAERSGVNHPPSGILSQYNILTLQTCK